MTISEIAKLAGVSSAAVSRYLNDGSLSQEKRQRIERVIRETKYRPSEYARTMRTKKSNRIGVLVPQIDSESVPKILSGISERMDQKNYHVLLMNSNLSLEKEIGILETFEQSQVDGLIFVASVLTKRHEKALEHMGVPVVILGQKSEKYPCIYHDDEGAACAMMEEAVKKRVQAAGIYWCWNGGIRQQERTVTAGPAMHWKSQACIWMKFRIGWLRFPHRVDIRQ